jgi:hypothetical protein
MNHTTENMRFRAKVYYGTIDRHSTLTSLPCRRPLAEIVLTKMLGARGAMGGHIEERIALNGSPAQWFVARV